MNQPKHVVRTTIEHVFTLPRGATARDFTDAIFLAEKVAAKWGQKTNTDDWYTVRAGDDGAVELVLAGKVTQEPYGAPQPTMRDVGGGLADVAGF